MTQARHPSDGRRKRNDRRRGRPLTLERLETRNLLAGPELEAVDFMVSLASNHPSIPEYQAMVVRLEPVAGRSNDTLRLSIGRILSTPGDRIVLQDLWTAQDDWLLRSALVDAILSDGRFGAALDAEYGLSGRDSISIEIDRGDGVVDSFPLTDPADSGLSPLEIIPSPVMPTLAHLSSVDPFAPDDVERVDQTIRPTSKTLPRKLSSHAVETDSVDAPTERLTDRLPGEGEVIRLSTTAELVANELDPSEIRLPSESEFFVTNIQRLSPPGEDTVSRRDDDSANRQPDESIVDSDGLGPDVTSATADASHSQAPMFAAVTSLEVALVFEFGGASDDAVIGAAESVSHYRPMVEPVDAAAAVPVETASMAQGDPDAVVAETGDTRARVRRLAAAPALLIVAGAVWTKVRSRRTTRTVSTHR
ncbi:hypothetical protein Mal15_11830 [Stieleria maiorica]|uniref:Uncharacterized protein n=1 Tax=Stieleria maiorica TaxID=2795974 RepID=A0A5B9MC59_9BACT|nr:hypothetical protein [Stieleria maiorica]QEF97145.1 hypothetical protein Mal15_11830 [Stieleria maiorica]